MTDMEWKEATPDEVLAPRSYEIASQDQQAPRQSLVEYQAPEPAGQGEGNILSPKSKKLQTIIPANKKSHQLADVLNSILPPRTYKDETTGDTVIQRVRAEPSSRDDVIMLQMKLDERLQERQARENGICPVREELYSQGFDELIRQVTIESPERGLLLLRVRDEVRMTIAAYQTLYQSSITFGMRKTLQAEQGNSELQAKIEELESDKKKLLAQVQDHRGLYEAIEKRTTEQRASEEKKMQEEKDFLKFQAQHLESFLKSAMQ